MSGGRICLFSWNVNGLRAVMRKGALREFVDRYRPDVLLLQETKISEAQIKACGVRDEFSEYEQFYSCATKPGYSGTAVWISKSFRSFSEEAEGRSPVKTGASPERSSEDDLKVLLTEGRLTIIELDTFYVVSVYVPNAKDDLSRLAVRGRWDEHLAEVLAELQKKKPVVVAGDFNVAHQPIDLARPTANVGKHGYTDEERVGFSALLERAGMVDSFRHLHPTAVKYSWWSHWGNARANNVGWRIDYFLVSRELRAKIKSAEIYPEVMGSDHCPVSVELRV